jgi:O-methyltransferase
MRCRSPLLLIQQIASVMLLASAILDPGVTMAHADTLAANISTPQAEAYLDLLEGCLSRTVVPELYKPLKMPHNRLFRPFYPFLYLLRRLLLIANIDLVRPYRMDPDKRLGGLDWPPDAETMIGTKRLQNLRDCVRTVVQDEIPGDLIETGVWRGGACIFMRGALKAYGDNSRTVWLADSFQGLPRPNAEKYPEDAADTHWKRSDVLGISLDQVKSNFARYHLLDDRVRFLKGWFSETLPTAPIQSLAILRLDGDMYESTMDALSSLYPRLSPGGFVIVDDYFYTKSCEAAISDYREANGIVDPIIKIDDDAVFWRRSH